MRKYNGATIDRAVRLRVIRVVAGKAATSIGFRTALETGHKIKLPVPT
jgi:hypothetical protein